eukprot:scaffold98773_cov18-Tisochrysis_lutea.AAC.3
MEQPSIPYRYRFDEKCLSAPGVTVCQTVHVGVHGLFSLVFEQLVLVVLDGVDSVDMLPPVRTVSGNVRLGVFPVPICPPCCPAEHFLCPLQ